MKNLSLLVVIGALPTAVWAQTVPVPEKHIPSPVLAELRSLESHFDEALMHDCAVERCVSKGCVYRDHAVVDLPRSSSLPGLGQEQGPGSVVAQEYLTEARCDFAHEKSVSPRDVQALVRRLEQRLSKGWLKVTVGRQILEPISASLSESPPPKPEPLAKPKAEPAPPPPPPVKWESEVAKRELWLSLLPHFSWMIAVFLATLAALVIIWALRRLGRESLQDKALLAQLQNEATTGAVTPDGNPKPGETPSEGEDPSVVAEQQRLWDTRLGNIRANKPDEMVAELVRQWLMAGDFAMLAKAMALFGDALAHAFPAQGDLAAAKVAFAEYMRDVDPNKLPSDAAFFRKLSPHALSSTLLAQADAQTYRSLRDEFGSAGIAQLVATLPARPGALVFALAPHDMQHEVARALPIPLRSQVAGALSSSNRMSAEDREYVFAALNAARAGQPLPAPPRPPSNLSEDRGRPFDAARALSVLLGYVPEDDRRLLVQAVANRAGGELPAWYRDVLHPDMLMKLPAELQADLLLQVDIKALAAYASLQTPAWRARFVAALSPTMQNALEASSSFDSTEAQVQMARRAHDELVAALKRLVASGRLSFAGLVG